MLGVPVCRAKRAAVASCVLSPSVSCRLPRSTVASVGLHGLVNAWQLITPGVFDAIVMRALVGRVLTEPWTSFCVRRLARFEIAGVDTSSTPGASVQLTKRPFAPRFRMRVAHARPGRSAQHARDAAARQGALCVHSCSIIVAVKTRITLIEVKTCENQLGLF